MRYVRYVRVVGEGMVLWVRAWCGLDGRVMAWQGDGMAGCGDT